MAGLANVTVTRHEVVGQEREKRGRFDFDSSYPTGGYALTPSNIGLTSVRSFVCVPRAGYIAEYDLVNNKVVVYQGDNTNAAAAPLKEVANATDLSAITQMRFTARGV